MSVLRAWERSSRETSGLRGTAPQRARVSASLPCLSQARCEVRRPRDLKHATEATLQARQPRFGHNKARLANQFEGRMTVIVHSHSPSPCVMFSQENSPQLGVSIPVDNAPSHAVRYQFGYQFTIQPSSRAFSFAAGQMGRIS